MSCSNVLHFVRINGKSMMPLLEDGDIGVVLNKPQYDVGDIVMFNYSQGRDKVTISHRIVYKNDHLYYCKGDNSLNLEKISYSDIIGKIVLVDRKGMRINILSNNESLKEFCDLSLKCAQKWEIGERVKAIEMARRCYIQMNKYIKSNIQGWV